MLWVLLLMGSAIVVLVAERVFYLHRARIRVREFVAGVKNILAKRRLAEALGVCEETPGPVAAVVKAALRHAEDDEAQLRHAVQEAAILGLPALEQRLGAVATIAQLAPLVGLLGTVLGMAATFNDFATGGVEYQTATALAHGMWQALLSTAGSLALAMLARVAQHFLASRVRAVVDDIEWAANDIMGYLLTEYRALPPTVEQKEGRP